MVSEALVSQIDWFRSLAALVDGRIPKGSAPARPPPPAPRPGKNQDNREWVIEQALNHALSVRTRDWKYIEPSYGGAFMPRERVETGFSLEPQLYQVSQDYEQKNVAKEHPEIVYKMQGILKMERDKVK